MIQSALSDGFCSSRSRGAYQGFSCDLEEASLRKKIGFSLSAITKEETSLSFVPGSQNS